MLHRITVPILVVMYLCIFLITAVLYTNSVRRGKEQLLSHIVEELGYAKAAADLYFDGMVNAAHTLRTDGNVSAFFKYPDMEWLQLGFALDTVSNMLSVTTSLHSMYLVTSESDTLFYFTRYSYYKRDKVSFPDREIFEFLKSKEMTQGGIIFRRITEPNGIQRDVFTTIGYDGYVGHDGPIVAVVVNMRASIMSSLISMRGDKQNLTALTDSEGTVILMSDGMLEAPERISIDKIDGNMFSKCQINGTTYYGVSSELERGGMKLVRLTTEREVNESFKTEKNLVVLLALLSLIIITLLWYLLRRWIGKPVTELAHRAKNLEKRLFASEKSLHMQALRSLLNSGSTYTGDRRGRLFEEAKLPFKSNEQVFFMEMLLCDHLTHLDRNGEKAYEALVYGVGNIIQEIVSADLECVVVNRVANGSVCLIGKPNRNVWDRLPEIISNSVDAVNAMLTESLGVQVVTLYSLRSVKAINIDELVELVTLVSKNRPYITPGAAVDVDEFVAGDSTITIKRALSQRADELIDKNFNDPELNVSELAKRLNVTPNYLSAVYKKETAVKLTDSIQNTRISAAQHMLETTDMLVSEIAISCGFAYNIGYFQQLFKKKTSLTPSQYRDLHQHSLEEA